MAIRSFPCAFAVGVRSTCRARHAHALRQSAARALSPLARLSTRAEHQPLYWETTMTTRCGICDRATTDNVEGDDR